MTTEDYKFFRGLVIATFTGSPDTSTKCGAVIATRKSKSINAFKFGKRTIKLRVISKPVRKLKV